MSRTWFITGASSGLGKKLAQTLLARGDRVAATARDTSALETFGDEHGEALWRARLDVTDGAGVRETVGAAFAALGRIDVIVSNAAFGLFGAAEEVSDEQIEKQIQTNLVGSMRVIRAVLPHLRAQGGGRVLQISSEGGQMAYPNFSIYHATKWGIEGFVESVAQEVRPLGIEFTIVEPGPIRTGFGHKFATAAAMEEYSQTPSGEMRRAFAERRFETTGDPGKMALAIISSAEGAAPRRLVLGRTAYDQIKTALEDRLRELKAQRDIALSTEAD